MKRAAGALHAVILAGGAGERFWPASRRRHPEAPARGGGRPEPARGHARSRAPLRATAIASGSCAAASTRAAVRKAAGIPARRLLMEP